MEREFKCGLWDVRYSPDDGGRIAMLRYDGTDLLTTKPASFAPPGRPLGIYEQRPVYGYDDCFPTVDACCAGGVEYADHGELWQIRWNVEAADDSLVFSTVCDKTSTVFTREMFFSQNHLIWNFSVENLGSRALKFMHVMHQLMPVAAVQNIRFCEYDKSIVLSGNLPEVRNAKELATALMNMRDDFCEVMLCGVKQGSFSVDYEAGWRLTCHFPLEKLPCVNIWWNCGGHPKVSPRYEFAIEPTAGPSNNLADLVRENRCVTLGPKEKTQWRIDWNISEL